MPGERWGWVAQPHELPQNQAMTQIRSPLQAHIVLWQVAPGDTVRAGDVLVVLQAMKMEHELRAESSGRIAELFFSVGEAVEVGQALLRTEAVVDTAVAAVAAVAPQPGPLHDRVAAPEAEADTAFDSTCNRCWTAMP